MRPRLAVLMLVLALPALSALAQAGQREAAAKVREGIERFAAGDFQAAGTAFAEADVAKPEDPWIALDRAAAYAAQRDFDKAAELLRKAALSRDAALAARAHYNLGCLAADKARALFGEHPENASPEVRQQGLGLLAEAVAHYRDCLRLEAAHAEARYNLESIRLWIKHMQAAWEEHDRQKQRKEMGLLEFLEMLQARQRLLRATSRSLAAEPDSPRRRQAVVAATTAQRALAEEIGPLKEKIKEEIAKPAQAGATAPGAAAPPPTLNADQQKAVEALSQLADEAGQAMRTAADRLGRCFETPGEPRASARGSRDPGADAPGSPVPKRRADDGAIPDAVKSQSEVVEKLDHLLVSVVPFPNLLQKAISQQQGLVDQVAPAVRQESDQGQTRKTDKPVEEKKEANASPAGRPAPQAAATDHLDSAEAAWEQGFLPGWSDALAAKAEQGLKEPDAVAAPLADPTSPAPDPKAGPPGGKSAPDAEAVQKQREAVKRALEKAVELCPKVRGLTSDAAVALRDQKPAVALPKQEEALKLLREIAEQMPKQDQQQDQKSQDQQAQDQRSQEQKQQQAQQKDASHDQAEATLRKARERQRERQELEKAMKAGRYRPEPVEKDW